MLGGRRSQGAAGGGVASRYREVTENRDPTRWHRSLCEAGSRRNRPDYEGIETRERARE